MLSSTTKEVRYYDNGFVLYIVYFTILCILSRVNELLLISYFTSNAPC